MGGRRFALPGIPDVLLSRRKRRSGPKRRPSRLHSITSSATPRVDPEFGIFFAEADRGIRQFAQLRKSEGASAAAANITKLPEGL